MDATSALALIFITWAIIGVVAGVIMGRRGHSWFTWDAAGTVLGPLVVPIAVSTIKAAHAAPLVNLTHGRAGIGPVHAIVGVDGSRESDAALNAAMNILGDRLGTLTIATVIDFDAAATEQRSEARVNAEANLNAASANAVARTGRSPNTVMLSGPPARAIADYAATVGADLVVTGSRGRGLSKAVLGSTAAQLASNTKTPVLIVSNAHTNTVITAPR